MSSYQQSSYGQGTSGSQNTSFPLVTQTPENQLIDQIAGLASGLATQQYNWAANQYNQDSALTLPVVNNYLNASQQALNLANNNYQRYTQIYQPMENNLVQDANRMLLGFDNPQANAYYSQRMGAAESGVAQSMNAGLQNTLQSLRDYGVDPSTGQYTEALMSTKAMQGAAEAGAAQTEAWNLRQQGQQERSQAIQVGEQQPGQIVNSLNSALQGYSGAVNTVLSNANTGANLASSAWNPLNTAMNVKLPLQGQQSQGTSGSQNTNASQGSGGGSGGGGRQSQPSGGSQRGGGYGAQGGGAAAGGLPNYGPSVPASQQLNTNQQQGGGYSPYSSGASGLNTPGGYAMGGSNTPGNAAFGGSYNSYTNMPQTGSMAGFYGNVAGDNWGAGATPFNTFGQNVGSGSFGGGYNSNPNVSGSYGGGGYQSGGAVDTGNMGIDTSGAGAMPTTGGQVPYGSSPSMGVNTDDVPASLNAGEFVVPRDVAAFKGQEFFQNLIKKSRGAMTAAPAHGKPTRRPMGPPHFRSRGIANV